jgi:hypothetical protein
VAPAPGPDRAYCQWQLELEFHRHGSALTGVTGGSLPGSAPTALLTDFIKFVAASNF